VHDWHWRCCAFGVTSCGFIDSTFALLLKIHLRFRGSFLRFHIMAPGPCSRPSAGMRRGTDRHTDEWPLYISRRLRLTRNVIIMNAYVILQLHNYLLIWQWAMRSTQTTCNGVQPWRLQAFCSEADLRCVPPKPATLAHTEQSSNVVH